MPRLVLNGRLPEEVDGAVDGWEEGEADELVVLDLVVSELAVSLPAVSVILLGDDCVASALDEEEANGTGRATEGEEVSAVGEDEEMVRLDGLPCSDVPEGDGVD